MKRVVSLLASATEIVCALGREGQLVGRSHECDFPPRISTLPVCTRPRFAVEGPSQAIDERVKELLAAGSPLYEVDAGLLAELHPDVILTQSHCVVCAVSDDDVARALTPDLDPAPRIVSLAPNSMADLWQSIRQIAEALDRPEQGEALVLSLKHRIAEIAEEASHLATRPGIACLEWLDPLMAAGNWVPELVEMAGGVNLVGVSGKHSPYLSWDDLLEVDPEIVLALPCGFDLARTRAEMPALTREPRFERLRATRHDQVYVADGNQYFNRPGPRLVESLEILAEILHPEHFEFGHEGTGWQRYRP